VLVAFLIQLTACYLSKLVNCITIYMFVVVVSFQLFVRVCVRLDTGS